MLLQDARDFQILFLSLFLILGIGTRDWTLRPDLMLVVMATCLGTQWLAASFWPILSQKLRNLLAKQQTCPNETDLANSGFQLDEVHPRNPVSVGAGPRARPLPGFSVPHSYENRYKPFALHSLKSAGITALGLCLLLRCDHYTTMAIAGSLAILSKFVFQTRSKHFFNPANFGIIAALTLTPDAWVSPGQWGDDWWYALLFAGTGGTILKRVGRWDTTAAFLGCYAILEAIRNFWLGWTWDVFAHRLMSGSLLLFALFMIADPRSIPNARTSRLIWAGCVAVLTFILRNQFFLPTAVFWALFALSPLTVLLDFIWSSPRFSWSPADISAHPLTLKRFP